MAGDGTGEIDYAEVVEKVMAEVPPHIGAGKVADLLSGAAYRVGPPPPVGRVLDVRRIREVVGPERMP